MALILNGKSWQDKDGYLSPVTAGTLNGAFGEERILTLDYSFDQSLNDCEIYFNPALFVEQGIVLEQTQTLPPSTAYWFKVLSSTTTGVENTMNLLNSNATEKNMSVTFELNADRLSFKIRLTCFLTADILDFLNSSSIDNSIRLLGGTKDSDELENLEESVYNSNSKGFGINTGVKVPSVSSLCGTKGKSGGAGIQTDTYIADSEQFSIRFKPFNVKDKLEIFVNGVLTASSGTTAGNNFGAEWGFDGGGYHLGAHPPVLIPSPNYWYIGGAGIPDRLAEFTADTGLTASLAGYQQIVWVNCSIGDTIVVRIAGGGSTAWEYEIFCPQSTTTIPSRYDDTDAWINSEFLFLNEGTMTNPVFELSRNSVIETEFATFEDTDVTLQIDHTSAISNAKVWVIDADNTVQSLDFKKAYGYQPSNYFDVAVPSNIGGNTYETSFVIDKTKLNVAGRYFIIAVYYDAANEYVASYISQPIFVTDVQFLTPTITGTIYNLAADFQSNYIEVSPLQRVCCEITLNKYTGFDAAYLGGNVKIGDETFTFIGKSNQGSFENTNRFVFSDSAGSLIIRFYLRVKEEWQNTEADILWNINFNVEYTTIAFPQRLSVTKMEQNKAVPNLTEIKLYKDGVELLEEGDTACDANFLRVETIKTAESVNYAQAAIWKDSNGNIYEEEAWSPISVFTQSSNAFQSDVEIQFETTGVDDDVNHKITNDVDNGEVGIIGYPPPLPISFIRHPIHNTTKTGRNTVFWSEYDYGAGKTLATVNGFPSSDFLFRVGTDTTPLNANDNAWAAFSDLSFAAFAALSIPAGSRIMVRYVGVQPPETEQLNICGYLEMRFSETAVNPKILTLPLEILTASADIMFFTGLNLNFTFLTFQTGNATPFSAKRTFTDLSDNFNLVRYQAGLGDANSPNNTFVPHLFLNRSTTTPITPNITINQIEAANVEVGNPAIPIYNLYYSTSTTDVPSLSYDRINDYVIFEENPLDWNKIPVGSYIYVRWKIRQDVGIGFPRVLRPFDVPENLELFNTGGFALGDSSARIAANTGTLTNRTGVTHANFIIQKNAETGTASNVFNLENSFSVVTGFEGVNYINTSGSAFFGGVAASNQLLLGSTNTIGVSISAIKELGFSILLSPPSLEECTRFCLGENTGNMQYEWDFTQIINVNELEAIGTIAHSNAKIFGGATIKNLYIP